MIRAIGMCLVMAVCLTGCRRKQEPAFVAADFHYDQMAVDAAYRLAGSYLPAKTSFVLAEDVSESDAIRIPLSAKLREMGFSVYEGEALAGGIVLRPTVFFISDREAVVVMTVGDHQLQRGYDLLDGDIAPASYWVRREGSNVAIR